MSGFVIFALVLTFVYVVYFSVMITLDLHGKKDEKKSEEETYDVGDMTNEEQPVAIEERNDNPDEGDMTFTEQIITIAAVVAGTMLTRFLPFILFPANKKTPPLVAFLGKMLPAAVMGMLVVYSLKDTQILSGRHGVPEAIAVALIVILQATLRNLLLTIAAGTIGYMLLVQYVFV